MNTSRRSQWLLAAAMAALPAMMIVSPVSARYAAQQNGHALDANTQAGSGGQNNAGPGASAVSGNQIVTGNVTGGRYFRGNVPYSDPNSFNGNLPSQGVDNFIRDSNGVPSAYAPSFSSNTPRAYYSTNALVTPPPAGYVSENFQGAVVGTGLGQSGNFSMLSSPLDALRAQNLAGTVVYGANPGTYVNNVTELPPPGGDATSFSATPLVSSAMFKNTNTSSQSSGAPQFNMALPQLPNSPDRFNSAAQLSSDQLNNPNTPQNPSNNKSNLPGQTGPNGPNAGPAGPNPSNAINPTPMSNGLNPTQGANQQNIDNPLGTSGSMNQQPMNTPLNPYGQPGPATPLNNPAYTSSLSTGQGAQQWLVVPPAKQSAQYKVLQERLDDFNSKHQLSDQDAYRQYQEQLLAQTGTKPPAGGGGGGGGGGIVGPVPGGGPGGGGVVNPGGPPVPSGGGANQNNPIKPSDLGGVPHITSLADGVRNVTLRALLTSAEDLMRQDKFASAVEKYDSAIQLTNNTNPLLLLGKANAELGSELYSRAEGDLRRAVAADSAVLMGQYDLNKMMDPKRIAAVRDDLQTLAKDSREVRPSLLLAYLEYNTGHDAEAQKYLADAEKLVGNNDPLVELMRTHWTFQAPQMNDANK